LSQLLSLRLFAIGVRNKDRANVFSRRCFGSTDLCLRGGTRASVPASAPSNDANHRIGSTGAPTGDELAGAPFFESRRVECEFHRLIHRFAHRFPLSGAIEVWNNRRPHVLLLCASELERAKKHGTPATSVAGVYSFMRVREPPGRPPPTSAASSDPAADICCRWRS
jgi:hypothetical protein